MPENDFFIMLHPQLFLERSTVMRTDRCLTSPGVLSPVGRGAVAAGHEFSFYSKPSPCWVSDHVVNYMQVTQVLCAPWRIRSDWISRPSRQPLPTYVFRHASLTYPPTPSSSGPSTFLSVTCWSAFICLNDPRAGSLPNRSAYASLKCSSGSVGLGCCWSVDHVE